MRRYTIINFTPESVVLAIHCKGEEDLKAGLAQLSKLCGEKIECDDFYSHPLANGSRYQVMCGVIED